MSLLSNLASAGPRTMILVVAGLVGAGLTVPATGQELPPRIKFGLLTAINGSMAAFGATDKASATQAVKELNAAGGIGGRPVDLVIADNNSDLTQTATETRRLISQEKVNMVYGPLVASFAGAAAPLLTEAKILSYPVTGGPIVNPKDYPYGFGAFYSLDSVVKALADFSIDSLHAKKIGLMTDITAQGKSASEISAKYIPSRGATITGTQEFESRAPDLTPGALSLRHTDPDVVIIVSSYADAGTLFKATEEIGWKVPIVNQSSAFIIQPTIASGGPDVFKSERVYSLGIKSQTFCGASDAPGSSEYGKLLARMKEAYPADFAKFNFGNIPWLFDAVALTKAAMEATKSVDGAVLGKWLEQNGRNVKAITGPIAISATEHLMYDSAIFAFLTRPDISREDGLSPRYGC